jgi:hypothetical protein
MTYITSMPSPRGTNREQLYILKGGARRSGMKGAYDERGGLRRGAYDDDVDPIQQIYAWAIENLDDADLIRLLDMIGGKSLQPAQDDDTDAAVPSLDPMQTLRRAPGQSREKAMDAMIARALRKQFGKSVDVPRPDSVATDERRLQSLAERFPGFERIGVHPMEFDLRDRPAIATDSARLKSLAERYPGFGAIGFA